MKTKVIHLIRHLKMGGAETLITEYALKINKDKFDIVIVTLKERKNTFNEKRLEESGVKVIYLGEKVAFPKSANLFKRIINKFHRAVLFIKTIYREKPSVIHTHLDVNKYLLLINTKKMGIKLFYTVHSEAKRAFRKWGQRIITRYCLNFKGMIPIALHSKMQQEVKEILRVDKCIVLPNGIDMNRFRNTSYNKELTLKSLKIDKNSFIIGHIGRFVLEKNHEFLIQLFANIKKRKKNAHLILIGIGELEEEIRMQVVHLGLQDSVTFLGNRNDIPELIGIMDVFVFPSRSEGFGNVLIEAQAVGVRCVVSSSVPSDAIITNLVTQLSLNSPIDVWTEEIIDSNGPDEIIGDLDYYDVNKIILKLEQLYLDH